MKKLGIAALLILTAFGTWAFASEFTDKYESALEANDMILQQQVLEENKAKLPDEIAALVKEGLSPDTPKEARQGKFFLAETLARAYKDFTGDVEPLKNVKKKSFDAELSAPVRPTAANGVHTIEMPKATDTTKNVFAPDNIVIKKGETVRWVNTDAIAHIFSAMPVISAGSFSSKSVPAGGSFEYKFDKPGDYFYLCFIHHAMVGKVTVEE